MFHYLLDNGTKIRRQVKNLKDGIETLTESDLERPSGFEWLARREMSVAESVLYNLRHVQHHAAQLNLVLRQEAGFGADWVHRSADA